MGREGCSGDRAGGQARGRQANRFCRGRHRRTLSSKESVAFRAPSGRPKGKQYLQKQEEQKGQTFSTPTATQPPLFLPGTMGEQSQVVNTASTHPGTRLPGPRIKTSYTVRVRTVMEKGPRVLMARVQKGHGSHQRTATQRDA